MMLSEVQEKMVWDETSEDCIKRLNTNIVKKPMSKPTYRESKDRHLQNSGRDVHQ